MKKVLPIIFICFLFIKCNRDPSQIGIATGKSMFPSTIELNTVQSKPIVKSLFIESSPFRSEIAGFVKKPINVSKISEADLNAFPRKIKLSKLNKTPIKFVNKALGTPFRFPITKAEIIDSNSITVKSFTQEQGLKASIIQCIRQDKAGRIFVGTDEGLYIMNGEEWLLYNTRQGLSDKHIRTILLQEDGRIVVGTFGKGINIIDEKNNTVKSIPLDCNFSRSIVFAISKTNPHQYVIGTSNYGIGLIDDSLNTITSISSKEGLTSNVVYDLIVQNNEIIASTSEGINILNPENLNNIIYDRKSGIDASNIRCVRKNDETLYFGSDEGRLFTLNLKTNKGKVYLSDSTGRTPVLSLLLTNKNKIYVGKQNTGLHIYDLDKGISKKLLNINSLGRSTYCIEETIDGKILFGDEADLSIVTKEQIDQLYWPQKNSGTITSVYEDDNIFILASGINNLLLYNKGDGSIKRIDTLLTNTRITSLCFDTLRNICYVGTYGSGVKIFDLKNDSVFGLSAKNGLTNEFVTSLLKCKSGELIIGTEGGGINIISKNYSTIRHYGSNEGLTGNIIYALCELTDNRIAIGCYGSGISILNLSNSEVQQIPSNENNGINKVLCLIESTPNKIYVGTEGAGIKILDLEKKTSRALGFPELSENDTIFDLKKDQNNNTWVLDKKGLVEIFEGGTTLRVLKRNSQFNRNTLFVNAEGDLLFSQGAETFRYQQPNKPDSFPPIPFYTFLKVNGKNYKWTSSNNLSASKDSALHQVPSDIEYEGVSIVNQLPQKLVLSHIKNRLSIGLAAVQLGQHEDETKFRYRLIGNSNDWNDESDKSIIELDNLQPGTYKLQVQSRNRQTGWSTSSTFGFVILAPLYKRWWAYFIYFAFVGWCIVLLFRFNTRRLRKKADDLKIKIDEATSEINEQKRHLEEKQKEILDSIHYARRIQSSLLPTEKYIGKFLGKFKRDK